MQFDSVAAALPIAVQRRPALALQRESPARIEARDKGAKLYRVAWERRRCLLRREIRHTSVSKTPRHQQNQAYLDAIYSHVFAPWSARNFDLKAAHSITAKLYHRCDCEKRHRVLLGECLASRIQCGSKNT